tara:strand:- start:172 stop:351 length:180 start_codon:yes stop_codon:yes gene_type:complete
MKKFLDNFKKNLADIPTRVEKASKGKFISLLFVLLLLPAGTILCLIALYFKFRNYFNKV